MGERCKPVGVITLSCWMAGSALGIVSDRWLGKHIELEDRRPRELLAKLKYVVLSQAGRLSPSSPWCCHHLLLL